MLSADVHVQGHQTLPAEVQVVFYRVAQEALNNIVKHADAQQVKIELVRESDAVELSIRDDGRGFDPLTIAPGQFGLSIMRERVESVGAHFSVDSLPGSGTRIRISWGAVQAPETPG
jgi:signal transduction histidine kinase